MATSLGEPDITRVDPPSSESGAIANPHHEHRWLILGVLGVAQLMVILDGTIVNIALPSAQRALQFSNADRQWIVTAYALAFGSLLLIGGRIGDAIGRKRALVIGLVGFAGASAFGGAAQNFTMLVTARAIQGAFGALLAPAILSLLSTTFTDRDERNKAFSIYGAIAGAGGALGLLLGGVLTSYASWRWTLFVNVAIAALALPFAIKFLVNQREAVRHRLDYLGICTVTIGLFALVYGLSHAETASWSNSTTIGSLVASAVLLTVFVITELRVSSPLLPMRVVLDRDRGASLLVLLTASVGIFGVFLFLTYYLQEVLGYSPVKTGLAFLPMVGALALFAQIANGILLAKVGPKVLAVLGMLIAAGGSLLFTKVGLHTSYPGHLLVDLIVTGVGLGLALPTAFNTATLGVSADDAGICSAVVNTSQQIGGSVGTALLNTLVASAAASYVLAHHGMAQLAAHAAVHSYTTAFRDGAFFFVGGAIISVFLFHNGVVTAEGEAIPV